MIKTYKGWLVDMETEYVLKSDHLAALEAAVKEKDEKLNALMYDTIQGGIIGMQKNQIDALTAENQEKSGVIIACEAAINNKNEQIAALTIRAESLDRIITKDTEREIALKTDRDTAMSMLEDAEGRVARLTAGKKKKETSIINPEPLGDEFQEVLNKVPYEEGKEGKDESMD